MIKPSPCLDGAYHYYQLLVTTPAIRAPTTSPASHHPHRQSTSPSWTRLRPKKLWSIFPTKPSILSSVNQRISTFIVSTIWSTRTPSLSAQTWAVETSECSDWHSPWRLTPSSPLVRSPPHTPLRRGAYHPSRRYQPPNLQHPLCVIWVGGSLPALWHIHKSAQHHSPGCLRKQISNRWSLDILSSLRAFPQRYSIISTPHILSSPRLTYPKTITDWRRNLMSTSPSKAYFVIFRTP